MEFVAVAIAALLVSGLTLYSGFGLGTLLMPVFALFFPLEVAIAATAVVHGANNAFKIAVVGRLADRSLVLGFGIPAILAAVVGATLLESMTRLGEVARYSVAGRECVITPIKLVIGVLMLFFAVFELAPRFKKIRFGRKYLVVGGVLSGFFGGLSGHQGALRSAFLVKVGASTEAFVGTNAAIGFMVDAARIGVYAIAILAARKSSPIESGMWPLIATGVVAAFAGVLLGKRWLHKVTIETVQALTGVLLLVIALGVGSGAI